MNYRYIFLYSLDAVITIRRYSSRQEEEEEVRGDTVVDSSSGGRISC